MTGLICTAVGIVLCFLAFVLGDMSGTKVTETKVKAVIDEANKQAEIQSVRVEANLKDLARKLVNDTPSVVVTSGKEEDTVKLAQALLEKAKGIGK